MSGPALYPTYGAPLYQPGSPVAPVGWPGYAAPLAPIDPLRGEALGGIGGYQSPGQRLPEQQPYAPPGDLLGRSPTRPVSPRRRAQDRVRWLVWVPAILLLINSVGSLVFVGLQAYGFYAGTGIEQLRTQLRQDERLPEATQESLIRFTGVLVAIFLGIQLVVVMMSGLGSISMLRFRNWGLSLTGSICAMLPFCTPSPCCISGIPIGILSIILLSLPNVRKAFD